MCLIGLSRIEKFIIKSVWTNIEMDMWAVSVFKKQFN